MSAMNTSPPACRTRQVTGCLAGHCGVCSFAPGSHMPRPFEWRKIGHTGSRCGAGIHVRSKPARTLATWMRVTMRAPTGKHTTRGAGAGAVAVLAACMLQLGGAQGPFTPTCGEATNGAGPYACLLDDKRATDSRKDAVTNECSNHPTIRRLRP